MLKVANLVNIFSPAKPQSYSAKVYGLKQETSWLVYAAILVNAALLLSYLLGVNAQASAGYEIKQLQKQVSQLNEEQKGLNLKLSEATAISQLNQDFAQAGLVSAGAPNFVTLQKATQTAMK